MESRCEPDAAVRCCLSVGDPFACRYLTNRTLRPSGGTVARDWVSKNAAASVSRRVERLLFRLISSLPSRAAWFCNKGSFFMGSSLQRPYAPVTNGACMQSRVIATAEAIIVKACEGCTEYLLHFSMAGSAIAPSEGAFYMISGLALLTRPASYPQRPPAPECSRKRRDASDTCQESCA
jgi:hypothetical protein